MKRRTKQNHHDRGGRTPKKICMFIVYSSFAGSFYDTFYKQIISNMGEMWIRPANSVVGALRARNPLYITFNILYIAWIGFDFIPFRMHKWSTIVYSTYIGITLIFVSTKWNALSMHLLQNNTPQYIHTIAKRENNNNNKTE